jgi:hypothetical protein
MEGTVLIFIVAAVGAIVVLPISVFMMIRMGTLAFLKTIEDFNNDQDKGENDGDSTRTGSEGVEED